MFDWFRRRKPPPPTPPLSDHWVMVSVKLHEPIPTDTGTGPIVGYFRNLGIRCALQRIRDLVELEVADGSVEWEATEYCELDVAELDKDTLKRADITPEEGVWYRSGRVLYSDAP